MRAVPVDDVPPALVAAQRAEAATRRRSRGHIADFGSGRRCVTAGCQTVISRYHDGDVCWAHEGRPPREWNRG